MIPVRRPTAASSASSSSRSRRGAPVEVRKVRVKAHAADDVRYIMIGTAVEYNDFLDRVRDKFGLVGRRFKIKIKDEDMPDGDMITMGDQDDLDMALSSSLTEAQKARQETGKLDVSFNQPPSLCQRLTKILHRSGFLKYRRFSRRMDIPQGLIHFYQSFIFTRHVCYLAFFSLFFILVFFFHL